ncbi:hypothetical protein [Lentzea flaviverrucosa]|uniref:hypothetical protein n=1 Tax=Lentzea flaviverrucosa TaxID=200379 RepID=UPI000A79036A|nr:hypothetical protein [Lentzea flaviverrucosa]
MDLTSVAAAVVRGEPGAFETFVNEAQGRSSDEIGGGPGVVRVGLPHRERLLAAAPADSWLYGLLMVVDLEPPLESWVETASVGPDLEPIPLFEGRRVVVLDPPPYLRSWNAGRIYPMMTPLVDVARVLPADEASPWSEKVSS